MIIIWQAGDRLGNRLLISAYGIALAEATGQRLVNLHLDKYEDLFPATRPWYRIFPMRFRIYKLLRRLIKRASYARITDSWFVRFLFDGSNSAACSPSNPTFVSERKAKLFTFIVGWPFFEDLTFPSTDKIRETFKPPREVLNETAESVRTARGDAGVLIGVHIRHGDYKQHLGGKYFYTFEQYRQIMEKVEQLFTEKVAFLVCSDAPIPIEEFGTLSVARGPNTLLGDMYSLSECDYILGTPSTYCLWAAFQGRKPIFILSDPTPPSAISEFSVPDDNFRCIKTIRHVVGTH